MVICAMFFWSIELRKKRFPKTKEKDRTFSHLHSRVVSKKKALNPNNVISANWLTKNIPMLRIPVSL